MSRGRALRTGVAFDMRTGFKVRGRRLVQDGERPGVWVTRDNADQIHPQRFVNVPPPDGLNYRPGPPAAHSIGKRIDLTWVMASDTHPTNGGYTQQDYKVLKRYPAPAQALVGINFANFFFGHIEAEEIPILWQGDPLLWQGVPIVWSGAADENDMQWGGFELQLIA